MTNFETLLKSHIEEIANGYGLKAIVIEFSNDAYGIGIVKCNTESNDGNLLYERQVASVSIVRISSIAIDVNIDYPRNAGISTLKHAIRLHSFDVARLTTILDDIDNAIFQNLYM
jgi:hypothetical protein